jgi:two-component system, LuxR family, sensor kinase FixL
MAKILIIDDRPLNRQFLSTLLGYRQHDLLETSDGAEGLRLARDESPDLIITDVLMPTMDGYEFVRRLRDDPAICQIPVVFSTAHYLSRESKALADKCGVTSTICKPCEPQVVLDIVEAALSGHSQPAPAPAKAEDYDRDHLQLLTNQLSEKANQLRAAHAKLSALIELSIDLAEERDPVQLLNRYCSVAREIIGARWTLVALLETDRKAVQHLAVVGTDPKDTTTLPSTLLETGIFVTVMKEGHSICLNDLTSVPVRLQLPEGLPRAGSLLVAPLVIRGKVDGWICWADKLGFDVFSEQDEQLAIDLAGKMAVAYDNARLYSDSTKYASKLEAEISERVKVEQELSESKARLAGIINSALDSIITIDSNQLVLMFNGGAEKTFCCTATEAIGQSLDRFIPSCFRSMHDKDTHRFDERGVDTGALASVQAVTGLRANGDEFPVEASMSQIEIGDQKLYTVIMRDITERKRADSELKEANQRLEQTLAELEAKRDELASMTQQLWQASKLATMGELAASIAHELNNPLATVGLCAETLLTKMAEGSEQRRPLEIIGQQVDRMASLVNSLLQFSRRSPRRVSTVDPRVEISNSIEFIHYHLRTRKIEVECDFVDPLATIQADRPQLQQVFLNLLTNACDAMSEGGKVTIRASFGVLHNAEAVAIEFTDTGEGITSENLDKIWNPFFTTKPEGKGTGLGLAICRRLVEEHGGTIDIQSQRGCGTSVRLLFPITSNEPGE